MHTKLQMPIGYRKNGRAIFRIAGGSQDAGIEPQGQTNGGTGQQEIPGQQNSGQEPQQQQQQTGGKPYDEYLQKIPEGLRPVVDGVFAEWDTNTNKKFMEYTNQLKEYEPYKQYVDQYAPEALDYAVGLAQRLETKESAEEFFQELAQALGYQIDGAGQQQQNGEPFDPSGGDTPPDPRYQQLETVVGSLAQNFEQWTQSQQEREQLAQAEKEWSAAVEKNKSMLLDPKTNEINKDAENMVLTIAVHQTGGDIDKAFEVYGAAVGKQAAAQNAPGQNAPIVGGGAANNMPSNQVDVKNLTQQQRKELAISMLKANNAQNR
jgi:hypothetical protein